jgi:hypothetical protein
MRTALPGILGDLPEDGGHAAQEISSLLRLKQQVHDALAVAAQQGGQITGADQCAVADRIAARGALDQCIDEAHVRDIPGVVAPQCGVLCLLPRQALILAQHAARQDAQRRSQHAVEPGNGLRWRRSTQDVIADDFTLAQQPLLIIEELVRAHHVRRQ